MITCSERHYSRRMYLFLRLKWLIENYANKTQVKLKNNLFRRSQNHPQPECFFRSLPVPQCHQRLRHPLDGSRLAIAILSISVGKKAGFNFMKKAEPNQEQRRESLKRVTSAPKKGWG